MSRFLAGVFAGAVRSPAIVIVASRDGWKTRGRFAGTGPINRDQTPFTGK